jgi:deoxyribodipyrimidine photo-lyase
MWFASIWIFTLELPWRIGADFFYRHLLDGDAASNTLSWRWVAGLHTRGKAYAAESWNIEKFTGGRFHPALNELRSDIESLDHTEPAGLPELRMLRDPIRPNTALPSVLLITDEDCHIEDFDLTSFSWKAVASIACSQCRSPRKVSARVVDFERGALADVARRNGLMPVYFEADSKSNSAEALVDFILQSGVKQVVTPYLTQGPTHDLLEGKWARLEAHGIRLCELRRDWDMRIWPHASAGFFKIKQRIPDFLRQMTGA